MEDDRKTCVWCRRGPVDPAYRPFCSERCQLLDLGSWMDGRYRVAGGADSKVSREHDGLDRAHDTLDDEPRDS